MRSNRYRHRLESRRRGDAEELRHGGGIVFGNCDDTTHALTSGALEAEHASGLKAEIPAGKRAARVGHMPAPDHGLDIVLEQQAAFEIGKQRRRGEKIAHYAVEVFALDQLFHLRTHFG